MRPSFFSSTGDDRLLFNLIDGRLQMHSVTYRTYPEARELLETASPEIREKIEAACAHFDLDSSIPGELRKSRELRKQLEEKYELEVDDEQ